MKLIFFFLLLLLKTSILLAQSDIQTYLKANRQDLRKQPIKLAVTATTKIIGFGALHGSAKTEEAEIILLEKLVKEHQLKYYFPETDFSTANFLQQYIDTGNEKLLIELVEAYGAMVPQEKSINVYDKWRKIRSLFKDNQVQIIGIDVISSYKFSLLDLLAIVDQEKVTEWQYLKDLQKKVEQPQEWVAFYATPLQKFLVKFVEDYKKNKQTYQAAIIDSSKFDYIIGNIISSFDRRGREQKIYNNYIHLDQQYQYKKDLQFFRFGVFHIMKNKINNGASFFCQLLQSSTYTPNQVMTIQGFLTKSRVLWQAQFDENGAYKDYQTKGGFGIADYWLEHYKNIRWLKRQYMSDLTLFSIQKTPNPFTKKGNLDLVIVQKLFGRAMWIPNSQKSTADYIDYALLIRQSEANVPIEALNK